MAEKFQSHPEFDDAVAPIPSLSSPVRKYTDFSDIPNEKNRNRSAPVDCIVGTDSQAGSLIQLDKKITNTGEICGQERAKNGSLADFSIDLDCNLLCDHTSNENSFCSTIIDVVEFTSEVQAETECSFMTEVWYDNEQSEINAQKKYSESKTGIMPGDLLRIPSGSEPVQLGSGFITELLGTGGMARVYKIWNKTIEMFRAVKLLLPLDNTNNLQRFHTESKISANLKHPNIIMVHETGEWQKLPYMEMEYVEGVTLQVFLQFFKSLPPLLCSAITVQIARALAYAHTQQILLYGKKYKGIIHRDLKPSNIMIAFNGGVKLMDFGVARPVETGLHTANIESIVGTLQYFPPEQVNGYPIDQLSDIYSFGAVLYEMLCGINPFPQINLADLIRAKTINRYTRLHEFKLTIDPQLASLAQICLRTDKHSRIQNSTLLRDYLEDLHYSWGSDSPESVIRSFFNSTETNYRKN